MACGLILKNEVTMNIEANRAQDAHVGRYDWARRYCLAELYWVSQDIILDVQLYMTPGNGSVTSFPLLDYNDHDFCDNVAHV